MLYPSTKELLEKVDSRYTLVMLVSKRARQLVEGESPLIDAKTSKPVSIAVQEIADNKIFYTRSEENFCK